MKDTKFVEIDIDGKPLRFETGILAKQAGGAVTAQMGETILFAAATAAKEPREGANFFPLQIEYREKFYAAGRFPGGYFKREARPSEKEILTSRVTDRPIRALFPKNYFNEVQIAITLFCADGENEADILSINAASAALMLSDAPFMGPIGAVRIGRMDGKFIVNPTHQEILDGDLNLVYVGTRDKMMMIEGDADEASEDDMVTAMKLAQAWVTKIISAQLKLREEAGLPPKEVTPPVEDSTLKDAAAERVGDELAEALSIPGKLERQDAVAAIGDRLKEQLLEAFPERTEEEIGEAFHDLEVDTVRRNMLEKGTRIDGRGFDELRSLYGQVGFLPRTHGSALFQRGETQAMAVATLGTLSDAQSMDAITGGPAEKRFMLHYNFPPYSVGETGRMGFTNRREIGHGNLAERSLKPVLPADYAYTIRLVSEIMESNGSSSMASVCVGSLALMDAGIPVKKPVAGISIGLVSGDDKYELLTDIIGSEDHCGDMDFKVAGTVDGITGFQVDLKIDGLDWEIVEGAFKQARAARMKILEFMATIIPSPREEMSQYAPQIAQLQIDPEKIGMVIGPGGKNIKRLTETHGVQIDIEDDGSVHFFGPNLDAVQGALDEVSGMTAEAEVGKLYHGTVRGIRPFGAFVEIIPGKDGLVHISELADYRVGEVEDICQVGDTMWVKCIGVDDSGKIRLSRKQALAEMDETGEEDDD